MEHHATTRGLSARKRIAVLIGLLLLLGLGGMREGYAQPLPEAAQDRLSPRLQALVQHEASAQDLAPLLPSVDADDPRYGVFVHTSDVDALADADVPAHAVGDGLATARLTPEGLRRIAQIDAVRSVELSRTYEPLNDLVRSTTGAHPLQGGTLGRRYTGDGVLACIIDTGIDWEHPDFRRRSDPAQSRIRALWDQTLSPQASEASPSGFSYGVEYTRDDVESALGSDDGTIRSTDEQGHGTQVAATIAGNGTASPGRTHRGMAPEAAIVAVKTDFSGAGIADGLRYCRSMAEATNRPVVANLSVGSAAGPHDGSSPLARAVDAFSGPGRSVVAAAGNDGSRRRHVTRSLEGGTTDSLALQVPRYSPTDGRGNDVAFRFDAWFAGGEGLPTAVVTPEGERVSLSPDTAAAVATEEGTVVYESEPSPEGDRHLEIVAYDASPDAPPASGSWSLVLQNNGSQPTTLHGWLVDTTTHTILPNGDRQSTVTAPGTAQSALTVGAWTHRNRWQTASGTDVSTKETQAGAVAPFSSRGPLPNGDRKPDLVAPGQWTVSARSQHASPSARQTLSENDYTLFQGTSAASAAGAGAVALLLEDTPSLAPDQIATLLTENARRNDEASRSWTTERGAGQLDVFRAMTALRGSSVATHSPPTPQSSASKNARTSYTLGSADVDALATQLTPSQSGIVDGLLLNTASGTAAQLRDSLAVSIWTDDDGTPGRRIAPPIRVAPETFANHTTNFIPLSGSEATVEADTNYHVVLAVESGGGELDVVADRSSEGHSSARSGDSWSSLDAPLEIEVSTSFALDLTAPRPTAPQPTAIIEASTTPSLSWSPVPNADAYTVQVSSSPQFPDSQTDTLRTSSPSLSLSNLGPSRAYHWRVRADRLDYAGPWSDPRSFLYYPAEVNVTAARSFGPEAESSSPEYRLVALPGENTVPLQQTLQKQADSDWTAHWDRGEGTDPLVSFDRSPTFHFRPGTGFWLRSDNPWRVETTVPSVPLQDDGTYSIELHDGWNVISNPFDLDVSWDAVQAANEGSLSPLWRFSGQFERASSLTSAKTGEAFYFLNDQGLETLRLPYPAFPTAASDTSTQKSAPSALTLTTLRDGDPVSQVRVGLHENAEKERDAYDQIAPPPRFAHTSLRLTGSGEDPPPRQRHLAADYRSPESEGHTFSLTLQADPGSPIELRAANLDVFDGQEVVLVDPAAGESHDLRTTSTIRIQPESEPRSLRLLVGSADYVETKRDVALPSDLQFLPNYPNPFSEQTSLEYVLPDPASVRLAVYDVLGRQVRVLIDEEQEAGRHTVQWNGRDESGQRMASGMYLARLVVDGTTKVRKMTFVR